MEQPFQKSYFGWKRRKASHTASDSRPAPPLLQWSALHIFGFECALQVPIILPTAYDLSLRTILTHLYYSMKNEILQAGSKILCSKS